MRCRLPLLTLFIFVTLVSASAQSITLNTTPRTQELKGYDVIYTVRASVVGNFKASIFLRVVAPTLPGLIFWASAPFLNAPYTDSSEVHVQVSGLKTSGDHEVYIEGFNGPLVVRDTVILTIPDMSAWQIFTTTNSGLLNDTVPNIAISPSGVGWIASSNGLANFDGTTWNTFTTANSGIPTNKVNCVALDSTGGVWLGTDSGLVEFRNNVWTIHTPADTSIAVAIRNIAVDSSGVLWITDAKVGWVHPEFAYLVKYDGTTWIPFKEKDLPVSLQNADHVAFDNHGSVWISTWAPDVIGGFGTVFQFDGTYWTAHDAVDATVDLNGDPWLISWSKVTKYVAGERSDFPQYLQVAPVKIDPIRISIDHSSNVWITSISTHDARRHGVGRHSGSEFWFYTISNSGLPSEHMLTTKVAPNNMLWIGTRKGLAILNANLSPLKAFTTSVDEQSILGHTPLVTSIAPLPVLGEANLALTLSKSSQVQITVLNTLGQEVLTVCNRVFDEGAASVPLDASSLPEGAYILQITAAGLTEVRTFVVQR